MLEAFARRVTIQDAILSQEPVRYHDDDKRNFEVDIKITADIINILKALVTVHPKQYPLTVRMSTSPAAVPTTPSLHTGESYQEKAWRKFREQPLVPLGSYEHPDANRMLPS